MVVEPSFQDSYTMVDSRINQIASNEIKNFSTVKRELLCDILHIPKENNFRIVDKLIREAMIEKCSNQDISPRFMEYSILCTHFHIPLYQKPIKKFPIRFLVLEFLVLKSPSAFYTREIAEFIKQPMGRVSKVLNYECERQRSWFEKIIDTGYRQPYLWRVTSFGIESYKNEKSRLLTYKREKSLTSMNNSPRRCSMKTRKTFEAILSATKPLTAKEISIVTKMKIETVLEVLKNDQYSKLPFFEKINTTNEKSKYCWSVRKEGIDYILNTVKPNSTIDLTNLQQTAKQIIEQDFLEKLKQEQDMLRDQKGLDKFFTPDMSNPIDQEIVKRIRNSNGIYPGKEERKCRLILAKRIGRNIFGRNKDRNDAIIKSRIETKCKKINRSWNEVVREMFCIEFNIKQSPG